MREQLREKAQLTPVVSARAPLDFGLRRRKFRILWRLFAIIEEFVDRNFKCSCIPLKGRDGRNGVPVLNARSVGTEQARTLLYVSLRETLALPHLAKSFSDEHRRENTPGRSTFQSLDTFTGGKVLRTDQSQPGSVIAYGFRNVQGFCRSPKSRRRCTQSYERGWQA